MTDTALAHQPFATFVNEAGPRIRRALVAAFGPEIGTEAAADAMSIAWERWDLISGRENPAGYVWGIGRNRALKRMGRKRRLFPTPEPGREPWIEPGLPAAIGTLSEKQRTAVLLTSGYGWTFREVAELMDVAVSTVQAHVERGMAKLRNELGVNDDES
ncbi:MAG: sigma-70 family RNA polymerase sigma factor [Acidimicrobiales bacterium]|nr:sigma-70 family RNA polymerase sigma factor [Acidimicrobiales bacterium]